MDQWKARAKEKGLETKCPWCQRYIARKLPIGMFTHCNDCNKDVVLITTREPAFKAVDTDDRTPWPAKATPEYAEFMSDQEATREDWRKKEQVDEEAPDRRKAPSLEDVFKDPLFEENKKLFDGIFSDSPFMASDEEE